MNYRSWGTRWKVTSVVEEARDRLRRVKTIFELRLEDTSVVRGNKLCNYSKVYNVKLLVYAIIK